MSALKARLLVRYFLLENLVILGGLLGDFEASRRWPAYEASIGLLTACLVGLLSLGILFHALISCHRKEREEEPPTSDTWA